MEKYTSPVKYGRCEVLFDNELKTTDSLSVKNLDIFKEIIEYNRQRLDKLKKEDEYNE